MKEKIKLLGKGVFQTIFTNVCCCCHRVGEFLCFDCSIHLSLIRTQGRCWYCYNEIFSSERVCQRCSDEGDKSLYFRILYRESFVLSRIVSLGKQGKLAAIHLVEDAFVLRALLENFEPDLVVGVRRVFFCPLLPEVCRCVAKRFKVPSSLVLFPSFVSLFFKRSRKWRKSKRPLLILLEKPFSFREIEKLKTFTEGKNGLVISLFEEA